MKSKLSSLVVTGLTICAALWAMPETVNGQIYVGNFGSGTIGEYNPDGTTINASLVSGLTYPEGIAVSGGNIFVANMGIGTIGEYTTAGATVNASLVSGLNYPTFLDVEQVPEPSSFGLLALGLGVLPFLRLQRK